MQFRTKVTSQLTSGLVGSLASLRATLWYWGAARYNENVQARWACNATAGACLGPVRRLLGRYSLTGQFFVLALGHLDFHVGINSLLPHRWRFVEPWRRLDEHQRLGLFSQMWQLALGAFATFHSFDGLVVRHPRRVLIAKLPLGHCEEQ